MLNNCFNDAHKDAKCLATSPVMEMTKEDLLTWASNSFREGENSLRDTAEALAQAKEKFGATQQEMAKAIGRSQGTVSLLLKWRANGFRGSPFGATTTADREYLHANNIRNQKQENADQTDSRAEADDAERKRKKDDAKSKRKLPFPRVPDWAKILLSGMAQIVDPKQLANVLDGGDMPDVSDEEIDMAMAALKSEWAKMRGGRQ
jgi:hypothetical protein